MTRAAVAKVLNAGGELSEGMLVWCKARHLVDGLVLGTEEYVNQVHMFSRECFGATRKTGARKLRRVRTVLRTMRDLQKDPLTL